MFNFFYFRLIFELFISPSLYLKFSLHFNFLQFNELVWETFCSRFFDFRWSFWNEEDIKKFHRRHDLNLMLLLYFDMPTSIASSWVSITKNLWEAEKSSVQKKMKCSRELSQLRVEKIELITYSFLFFLRHQ